MNSISKNVKPRDEAFVNYGSILKVPKIGKDGSGVFIIMAHTYGTVNETRIANNVCGSRADRLILKRKFPKAVVQIFAFSGKELL
jgi:hypothetical protein